MKTGTTNGIEQTVTESKNNRCVPVPHTTRTLSSTNHFELA